MNSCTLDIESEYGVTMDFMRALDAQLDVGESVRWIGRPQFMPMLINGVVRIIIGCVFAALSLPDVLLTLHKQDYSAQGLVPALFLLIGTGVALTPIINAFAVGRTTYAVTDRRLLILTHILRSRVQSFSANAINAVDVSEKADGSGSVTSRTAPARWPLSSASIKCCWSSCGPRPA